MGILNDFSSEELKYLMDVTPSCPIKKIYRFPLTSDRDKVVQVLTTVNS